MNFKNLEEYMTLKNEILAEADALVSEGQIDAAAEKIEKVKDLDNEAAKFKANLEAFEENRKNVSLFNISDFSKPVQGTSTGLVTISTQTLTNEEIYVNAWAKHMQNVSMTEDERIVFDNFLKNEPMKADGNGLVIPDVIAKGIWREIGEIYPLFKDIKKMSVAGTFTLLKGEESEDAKWYDEDTEVELTRESFGTLTLSGCELARAIGVSWMLKAMSINEFLPYIQTLLAEKMGAALAYAVALGKGKPSSTESFKAEPRGIITALKAEISTPQVVKYTGVPTYEIITKLMSKIKSSYAQNAVMYANGTTIWNVLANIKYPDGTPVFVASAVDDGVGRIFGKIVKEDDSIPDGDILFGNAKKGYLLNTNKPITLDQEDHKRDRTTIYIAYAIVDGDVVTTKAFALLTADAKVANHAPVTSATHAAPATSNAKKGSN